MFYIKDEKSIAVETIGGRDASYDSFLTDLMKNGESECRYGLYDMEYEHQCQGATEVSKKQKLFLMAWCPDTAKIKKKMLYSSSFDALKKSLVGVHKYVQVRTKSNKFLNLFRSSKIKKYFIEFDIIFLLFSQATDSSEASEEQIMEKLRSTDRS